MNDFERARKFIAAHSWHFAKTMASIPHWYCLRSEKKDYDRFKWFVTFIRENSREGRFYSKTYRYFYLWGWKYWDMDPSPAVCDLVNRDQYKIDFVDENPFEQLYDMFYFGAIREVLDGIITEGRRVCDLYCGNGALLENAVISDYFGVDCRRDAIRQFHNIRPDLQGRLFLERAANLSYESIDVVVSMHAEMLDADDLKRVVNSRKSTGEVLLFSKQPLEPFNGLNLLQTQEFSLLTTLKRI